jgi:catalase
VPREVDDFKQPDDLYRLQPKDPQQRLGDNIAGSLALVSREDIITRSIAHFAKATLSSAAGSRKAWSRSVESRRSARDDEREGGRRRAEALRHC